MCADTFTQGVKKSRATLRFILNSLPATCPYIYDAHRKLSSHRSNERSVLFSCFMFSLTYAAGFYIGTTFEKPQNRDSY